MRNTTSIKDLMHDDHRACDDEFARVENAIAQNDWQAAAEHCEVFVQAMERHFSAEESVLFPAFEKASGLKYGGPTEMMRREHVQIRELMEDMQAGVKARDEGNCRGCAETLLIMMQQHNMKEENILYPACDEHLQGEAANLATALAGAIERAHA